MTRHQEPMTTRSTALLQQIEGGVLGRYRSCLFSGHDTPPAQLTLPLPSVYHLHSQFPTLVFLTHPDHAIFESLPRAGQRLAPRLLAEIGDDRGRYQDASSLQALA